MREGAKEEQTLVEADEGVGVGKVEARELGEEFGDDGGVAGVEAALGGFELGKEVLGIVRSRRHGQRDSVAHGGMGGGDWVPLGARQEASEFFSETVLRQYSRARVEGIGHLLKYCW